jgi:Zn-dependent metalloprotease
MKPVATEIKQRIVFDANNGTQLPGTVVRQEGDPPVTDVAVNEAYDGSGVTYDMFYGVYGRNSIDNKGLRLDSTVHYNKGYDNAFWNGQQMVYGDGDEDMPESQRLFNRFTIALDVIGHELTHGVTQYEAGLVTGTAGGAERSLDVFVSSSAIPTPETADQANWIIGEGLFTANVSRWVSVLKAPGTAYNDPVLGKDPQPAHMNNYVKTVEDNGGVHINSGIPNHAFYIAALEMGGYAWEKAGQIWYKTLAEKLTDRATFQQAADLTFEAAAELYGAGSKEQNAVKKGWTEVGITIGGDAPTGCLTVVLRALGLTK